MHETFVLDDPLLNPCGLASPQEVLQATQEYQAEMDTLGQWMEECCVISDGASAKASSLYISYHAWAERTNAPPLNPTQLGFKLRGRGFQKEKKDFGNMYVGISIKHLDSLNSLDSFATVLSESSEMHS
jgi:putative DNA primase/helicase